MTRRPTLSIPDHELEFRASRSGGPGGQHVNTSSTRVELTWNVRDTPILSEAQRQRVVTQLANRIDAEGWLRVVASDSRSQFQNRERARERLERLVERALIVPNVRKPTKIPRREREKRLGAKRQRATVKQARRRPPADD